MGHCSAVAINNFIAEITSCYLCVHNLSMRQAQQVLSEPVNDTEPYLLFIYGTSG